MAAIVEIIDIARPREYVFAYATDFARFPEWQGGVVSHAGKTTSRLPSAREPS